MKRGLLKRMGYLSDQKGIINRYLREMGGWDSHLYRCRDYILRSADILKPETVTILGSGWLLDVPLEELAESGMEINLVDINHPPQVRRRVARFSNVTLVEDDITGGLSEMVYRLVAGNDDNLPDIKIPEYLPDYHCGLVISLNILTQLDMFLTDYLVRNSSIENEQLRQFRGRVQQQHISFLKSRGALLISDFREDIYRDNDIIESNDLLFTPFPEGTENEEWDWEFDTRGMYYSGKKVVFRVKALKINS